MSDFLARLLVAFTILGPGALAPADPGVLEGVADRRLRHGWRLEAGTDIGAYDVLIAIEECGLVGAEGVVIVGGEVLTALVVDCQYEEHEALSARGIVADVNRAELGHRLGTGDLANPPIAAFQAVQRGDNLMRLDALPQAPEPPEPVEPPLVEEPPVLEPEPAGGGTPLPPGEPSQPEGEDRGGLVRALLVVESGCPNLIVRPSGGEELKLVIVSRGPEWFGRLEELLLDDVG